MKIEHLSHLHAHTILRYDFEDAYTDLLQVLEDLEAPLRAPGPFSTARGGAPKRQRRTIARTQRYAMFPIDQSAMNARIDHDLAQRGWVTQPLAAGGLTGADDARDLTLRGDFVKHGVFVEVEFGNVASMYRDLFKFQVANRAGAGEVGVIVTGTAQLMKFCDQGVATFETAVRTLPYMRVGIQMPTWIVGLEPDDWEPIRGRYDEMAAVARDNGVDCHDFGAVHGADIAPEETPTATEPDL